MRIFITGGSGTIGRRLVLDRLSRRHEVIAITRSRSRFMKAMLPEVAEYSDSLEVIEANPMIPGPWQQKVDGCDAVINLAGAGVLDRRWTDSYRQLLRESRIDTTYQIVRAIEGARSRPGILLNASAIGFYGDREDRELDEGDQVGEGFLADLCNQWESQAWRAEPLTRVICMRFGMILDREGGALPRMLKIFKLGLGGRLASGRQHVSWIVWQDLLAMIDMFLRNDQIRGPVNVVSPHAVTNRVFTKALASQLRRPALFPAPALALKLALGGGSEVVLASQNVKPALMEKQSFKWLAPSIDRALRLVMDDGVSERSTFGERLIVLDIDTISPGEPLLRRLLRRANEHEVRIVLSTSMGPEGARQFLLQSRIECQVIAADGAVIMKRDPSSLIVLSELTMKIQSDLMSSITVSKQPVVVTFEDKFGKEHVVTAPGKMDPIPDCIRCKVTGDPKMLEQVLKFIGDTLWKPGHVLVNRDRPGRLDIVGPRSERCIAVQTLARKWGVPRPSIDSIVSNTRALGLARWCGTSIALSGAASEVQAECDVQTEESGIEGVAEAVDMLL
tara:strand:+ start:9258 stop:10943 length:1686 start_codon:yes stop_codon:yes gene_type:complete